LIGHPTKKEGIGSVEILDRVTMQFCIRDACTVIAAAVQGDVDGITKGSHDDTVPSMGSTAKLDRARSLIGSWMKT
jgi:hypothetical protein